MCFQGRPVRPKPFNAKSHAYRVKLISSSLLPVAGPFTLYAVLNNPGMLGDLLKGDALLGVEYQ